MTKKELIKELRSDLIPDDAEVYFSSNGVSRKIEDIRLKPSKKDCQYMVVLQPLTDMFINPHYSYENK